MASDWFRNWRRWALSGDQGSASSIFLLPKCRAKRPLLLPFPAERKRKGPRGLSASQFFLSLLM